jgi:cell division protein FtsZ
MSTGYGEGEGRVKQAIEDALNSPLLNDNDIYNSRKILLSIAFSSENGGDNGLMMDEMNDVNDFMSKFGSDFEIKWGIAIDPELDKKVKVTILATGFGIENVDGMNNHLGKKHTQEEANRIAEEEEKAAERQDRRNRYYGKDNSNTQYKRRPHIFLFRPEDLDNEDVILAVESTPTYKRTRQMLDDIRNLAQGDIPENDKKDKQEPVQGIISFA